METVNLPGFNEKRKLVECLVIGTTINNEKRRADNGVTKNKYRNSNSDEVNQIIFEEFKDKYSIDKYKENGYEHIRLYSPIDKNLYVILRETTFQEQIDRADNTNVAIHYLYAYAAKNKHLVRELPQYFGQLMLFGGEDKGIVSEKEVLIQQKVNNVIRNMDIEVVYLITYNVIHGKVVAVKSRVLHPDITCMPVYEEDMSEYIVSYNNEDESVGFVVEPSYIELLEDKQDQEIQDLLKLKRKQKDQEEDK